MPVPSNVLLYDDLLKYVYEDPLQKLWVRDNILLERLQSTSEFKQVGGRNHVIGLGLAVNQSFQVLAEYGTAQAPSKTRTVQALYTTVQHVARARMSRRAIESSDSPEAAFQNVKELELESLMVGTKQNQNRQFYGDCTGRLTNCGAVTSNTIPVGSTQYMFEDAFIDIYNRTNGALLAAARQITAVDEAGLTITINGAPVTTTTDHSIYRVDSYGVEMDGFAKLVQATGAVGGVAPTDVGARKWKAYRDTVGGLVSLTIFNKPFQYIQSRGGKINLMIAGQDAYNAMANYLEAQKRIPVRGTAKLEGGMLGMSWNGIDTFWDVDCAAATCYVCDTKAVVIGEVGTAGWMDQGDGRDRRYLIHIPGTTYFEAMFVHDCNLMTRRRDHLAAIDNLS